MPQFTWTQPTPWFDVNDSSLTDIRNALWKAVTIQSIKANGGIVVGSVFVIYGLTFTITEIMTHGEVSLSDNYGRAWNVPAWPWTSYGA
jgi:hypothetical protein